MPAEPTAGSATMGRGRRENFDRWLHRTYSRSHVLRCFLHRRIRPAGTAVGLVLVMAACLSVGSSRGATYQLFTLSLVMLIIGVPWAMLRRASLEGLREVPRHATAGMAVSIAVRVRNTGAKQLARAWLCESPPDPRPDLTEFVVLREPGEEERNKFDRTFAHYRWQWLLLRRTWFIGGTAREELRIDPGGSMRVFVEITPLHRGIIRLSDLRVYLPDPLGLFQKAVNIKAPAETITVLPRRYALPDIELPGGSAFKVSGEANTNSIGTSGEFVGLRDYRPGDPLRQIHWKSWARTGHPIVKEVEDTYYPRYGLVLDTLSTQRSDVSFEECVSLAASFVAEIDTNKSLVDLMFVGTEAHVTTAGRGLERAEKLLEVLAGVAPSRTGDHEALARLVLDHSDDLTSCIVIFNGWDDSRAELLRKLVRRGVICVPFIICEGPRPADAPGHWLESGHVARDLMRLPARL